MRRREILSTVQRLLTPEVAAAMGRQLGMGGVPCVDAAGGVWNDRGSAKNCRSSANGAALAERLCRIQARTSDLPRATRRLAGLPTNRARRPDCGSPAPALRRGPAGETDASFPR